ncbi:hypothetical protein PVAP13_4KG135501 [Panicum virgatum]|uniref:Secreted protein n=1 Tax=Panicum virgatum TaxID=38727 RepID=A0A8T0TG09_PANVG|nr:hypothetical protein PVAP13_4KG135501 [Panicum virgatum]
MNSNCTVILVSIGCSIAGSSCRCNACAVGVIRFRSLEVAFICRPPPLTMIE